MYSVKINIKIHGSSAHGSMPHLSKDAIAAASYMILSLQTVVSRACNPLNSAALTFSSVHAGTQFNIITDLAELEGILYASDEAALESLLGQLQAMAAASAAVFGCRAEISCGAKEAA